MKSISQQTRSLIHKQQELGLIDSRISQLKQQLQLQESNNHIIEFKVNKILETKKNTSKDQSDYSRRLENLNQDQQNRNSKIKLLKHLQEEDSFRRKRDLDEEKRLEQEVMKERSMLYQLQYKNSQNEELQIKQQQFQKIQEQKFRMKQKLDLRRIEKIENVRNCQIKKKAELTVKFDLQQQEYQLKIEEEQQLLKYQQFIRIYRKLSFSQLRFQALKDDLDLAQKISIRDYTNSSTNQGFIKQPLDQSKIKKVIFTSPYAQIPSILNQKDVDKLNLLSKLLKPSFKDQQQTTERLNKKNNQTYYNTQLSDRTHTKENSSKFDTETSQTQKNKFQSKQNQNNKLDAQTKSSSNFNENLDTQKLLKSENKSLPQDNQNEKQEEEYKENQQEDNYEQEEISNYKDDNQEDENQPLQQDQQNDQNQEQQNIEEFQDDEQYPADDDEEQ
ncbi:unnamed protein product [Paramecium pentaurelia]|uniref:Uncharacterized protein n=1 Tax=Paramecium pentaurelia TaxID=43138 RepID=A0A8S1TH86_9CILI|nr:unnamed protein product [Paramecium pentaurelia]